MHPKYVKLKKMPKTCWHDPKCKIFKEDKTIWNNPSKNILRDRDKDGIPDQFDPMPNKKSKWKDKI